jgi:thioredoxin reductase (NADPH)
MSTRHEDVIIVGAGPIGLACGISAARRGYEPLIIDAGAIVNSILCYPIGMVFFTTPERLEIGDHPLACAGAKATREEALKYYRGVARTEGLRIETYVKLLSATRVDDRVSCRLETRHGEETVTCDRLVLATGYFDHPNRLGVPGEDQPHVHHYFDEAHRSVGLPVVVVGGKNSAVEAALQLYRAGADVTIVHRGQEWPPGVKYWLRPDLENRIANGDIRARLGCVVTAIEPRHVVVQHADGRTERLAAERVYPLIGFRPDFALYERVGVAFDPETGKPDVNPDTLETTVPGIHLAGSAAAGLRLSEVFIENGRFDGEKIFGDAAARADTTSHYERIHRPLGE